MLVQAEKLMSKKLKTQVSHNAFLKRISSLNIKLQKTDQKLSLSK